MKRTLLVALSFIMACQFSNAQERYLDEIFSGVTLNSGVVYGSNYDFLTSNPFERPLEGDMYMPTGDTASGRACVVVLHTGNFLPKYLNGSASGTNKDSSIVESCNLFAKRGYVVMAPNYRGGWDPANQDPLLGPDIRKGTLLNAVYRALNDAKTCVRYLKSEASNYGIDPNKIIVYGQGSGGYLALAYGSLDRISELETEPTGKWVSTQTVPGLFVENQLYIDTSVVGGIDGFGGSLNIDNHPGYSNDVMACVNVGGALGDSLWMEPGEPPLISFHVPSDPFAPFVGGLVIVPTTGETVVDVVGSRWAVKAANDLGNNDAMRANAPYTDPYSQAAYASLASTAHPDLGLNATDYEGLFPFIREVQVPGQPAGVYFPEASPWDWWDEATVISQAAVFGQDGQEIHDNGLLTNPDMSPTKGRAYLDTIMGYLAPRLVHQMIAGVEDHSDLISENTFIYPNPTADGITIRVDGYRMNAVEIFNLNGALVANQSNLNSGRLEMNVSGLPAGLYVVRVMTDEGYTTRKLTVK